MEQFYCKIKFDSGKCVRGGEALSGSAEYDFLKTEKMKGIIAVVRGRASVEWQEEFRSSRLKFCNEEIIFESSDYLFGTKNGDDIEVIPGNHAYSFNFDLPVDLPSSFKSTNGKIEYCVTVAIDRGWRVDFFVKTIFDVTAKPTDLNSEPNSKKPFTLEVSDFYITCCTPPGRLTIRAELAVSGIAFGLGLPITININNSVGITIKKIVIKLRKNISYTSAPPFVKIITNVTDLSEVKINRSLDKAETFKIRKLIGVPMMNDINLTNCSVIKLSYDILLRVSLGCLRKDLVNSKTIYVGSIPLSGINFFNWPQGTSSIWNNSSSST